MTIELAELADRARSSAYFLASLLHTYAEVQGLDDAGLCRALGCSAETLPLVRLCRVPRESVDGFRQDVEGIARRFGLEAVRIAEVVKQARAMQQLSLGAQVGQSAEAGLLLAARDRRTEEM